MLKSYLSKLIAMAAFVVATSTAFAQIGGPVTVNAPAAIAGDYLAKQQVFGPFSNGQSGEVVLVDDAVAVNSNGCEPIINDVNGKIALIDRGVCAIAAVKGINAQNAGAIAVIVCNNLTTFPDSIFQTGGSDCNLTIPIVMVSYNTCQTIKAELANGTVTANMPSNQPNAGEAIGVEIPLPGAGTYTATALTGDYSIFTDPTSTSLKVYSVVAAADAVMNVNSCNGGTDTRVTVIQGCRNFYDIIGSADDECDATPGDGLASNLDVIVRAGETYLIVWDNVWSSDGFDFNVSFSALPPVDVTFQVDMKGQTIAPDGVKISINAGAEADMTDSGGNIWTYTTTVTAGDDLSYVFLNGTGNAEDNPELVDCRSVSVGLAPVATDLVCYNSCSVCPPDAVCPLWVNEDFEAYTLGPISDQSDVWNTWTQPTNAGENASVSNEQHRNGVQSLKISAAAPADDQLLLLGNRTTGHHILKWNMFVPTGSAAYYNMQKNQDTPGVGDAFSNEVTFNINGTGAYNVGGAAIAFNYPHDVWFTVIHDMDLDNNINTVTYNGVLVAQHPANWQAGGQTGIKQLGAIDFYGNTGVLYYVDDVTMKQVDACPADALICDGFDGYYNGLVGPQSPHWTGWSQVDGGLDDGEVTSAEYLSCEQALKVSAATPAANSDDIILLLGDRPTGNYSLSWNMYVPTGSLAYYNIQKDASKLPNGVATADYAMEVYFNASGAASVNAGGTASSTFTYQYDTWFSVQHLIDLDNNLASLWVDGVKIQEWNPSWDISAQTAAGVKKLGGVDFYGAAGVLYYVDDVLFEALPAVPGNICGSANDIDQYFGQGVGTVTSTPLWDNTYYTSSSSDPATGFECFGEPNGAGAAPELNNTIWYTFVGDGETYLIETAQCGSTNYIDAGDTQMAIYSGTCGALVPVSCNEDGPSATATEYPAGIQLVTTPGTVYYMLVDGFNFQGALSDGEFCVKITQVTGTPTVDVTFRVNMEKEASVNAQGVRIAGSMTGWADVLMTDVGNKIWETTIELPVGDVIQYKFKNGPNGWETNDDLMACGVDDGNGAFNRQNTIGSVNQTLGTYCFNWCVDCSLVGTNETVFAKSIGMNPNPAGDFVNLTYNFENLTNLNVRLVNSLGQLLLERKLDNATNGSERLDIASLPSGAYTVVFSNGEQVAAKRLIVQ